MSYSEVFLQLGPASFRDVESLHEPDASSDAASSALKLQKALCMCRSKFATDARDKVYGLLGVLPDDVQKHIVPDYDVSIKDVFTKAAEYIISNTKRLDVLGMDWPAGRFSASASTKSKADLDSNNHRILSTWAIEIDRVVQTGIPISTVNTVDNFIMSFMHWYAMLQKDLRDSDEAQKRRANGVR
ncbi:hypothetical protein SBRCBS47491_003528 [Sporothrix bragantina]|uniref:Uncharacterized protein n=1 Tax=Sporothrix bragantina TaxID=671064 RepID=A0ABP0BG02_9PEZI